MINVATEFSPFPMGRTDVHGPHNGSAFQRRFLLPALEAGDKVNVNLTGTKGLAPSFLDEAFGSLVNHGYTVDDLRAKLEFTADRSIVEEIWGYIEQNARVGSPAH